MARKSRNKTLHIKRQGSGSASHEPYTLVPTVEISIKESNEEIPVIHRSYLQIIDSGSETRIDLGEREILIGRSLECGLQLRRMQVSRKHARVIFRNEEYQIEDLGSTNGTYVNGIRIEKCVLRNKDQIDISDVRILFSEERALIET